MRRGVGAGRFTLPDEAEKLAIFVAVATVRNEADIIEASIRHQLAEGAAMVLVCDGRSGDGTRDILQDLKEETGGRVLWYDDDKDYHDQPYWTDAMASIAEDKGAQWVVPFDADELHYAAEPDQTLADALALVPDDIDAVTFAMYQHLDWWWRLKLPKPMRKVAWRTGREIKATPGNHGLRRDDDPRGEHVIVKHGMLLLREIQYRGFEHFCRKIEERNATIDPSFPPEIGFHHKQYAGKDRAELLQDWKEYEAFPWLWDPVVTRADIVPEFTGTTYPISELFRVMLAQPHDMQGHMETLRDLVVTTDAQTVVECGVNSGMSSVAFLAGLEQTGGMIYSCDVAYPRWRPEVEAFPRRCFYKGDSLGMTKWIDEYNRPDVCLLDTSHTMTQTVAELKAYWPLVRPGGAVAIHDTESCPEVEPALRHFLHTLDTPPVRIDRYRHSEGMAVLWK